MIVKVRRIAPFKDGHSVLGLYASWDATFVEVLKAELARQRVNGVKQPGGWLPELKAWFVEEE